MNKEFLTLIDAIITFMVIKNIVVADMNIYTESGIINRISLSYLSYSYYLPTLSVLVLRHDEYYSFGIIYLTFEDIKKIHQSILTEKV